MSIHCWKANVHLKCDESKYNARHFLTTSLVKSMCIDNVYYTSAAADRETKR